MQAGDINERLDGAYGLVESGHLVEALSVFEQLCREDAGNAEAWMMRGSVNFELGNTDDAFTQLTRAAELDSSLPESFYYLARIHQQRGNQEQALSCIEKTLTLDPEYGEAMLLSGAIHGALGQLESAEQCYRKAADLLPGSTEAWIMLGRLNAQVNEPARSAEAYRTVLSLQPDSEEACYGLGFASYMQGQHEDAVKHFSRALDLNPGYAEAANSLGTAHQALGKYTEALEAFQRALDINPESAEALFGKARALIELSRPQEAVPLLQQALLVKPDYLQAYTSLAAVLMAFDEPDKAMQCCHKALELQPDNVDVIALIARVEAQAGKLEQAYQRLKPHISADLERIDVNLTITYGTICRSMNRPEEAIDALEALRANGHLLSADSRRNVFFCLGSLHDKMRDFDKAFDNYKSGNELRATDWNPLVNCSQVDAIIEVFSKTFLDTAPRVGIRSDKPVFVLGMPRSGTTLVEQVLASHPAVFGAGELHDLYNLVAGLPASHGMGLGYPQCMPRLDENVLGGLARTYLARLGELAPDAARVTDKMPGNFSFLGLIELLFPDARVVHCVRDPLDTCLSCYFQDFAMSQPYSYDLANLGAFYRDYERLMEHWKTVLTIPMLDVSYEEMISDQEAVSRRLIEFCGLEWDDDCLQFHTTERFVATSSYDQVRQPIYSSSVRRWEKYEAYIGPLREALR